MSMNRRDFSKIAAIFTGTLLIPKSLMAKSKKDDHNFKSTESECVWKLGTPCGGKVSEVELFNKQILVPICSNHLHEHRIIMSLGKADCDIEQVLDLSDVEREKMLEKLDIK